MNVSIEYDLNTIADIIGGTILQQKNANSLHHLLLDSRKLISAEQTIFFAIKTSHQSAEKYIKELFDKGVENFVVQHKPDLSLYLTGNFILVENVLNALHTLAAHHRQKFKIPVVGITGSNGKTIVKEWLNQLLQDDFNIVRSPKSFNSQIGVPLSVLQMRYENTLAIFEAGISEPDEMNVLEKMIQPTIGIFTNIGEAHSEGFKNINRKIKEKLQFFTNAECLIFCEDHKLISKQIHEHKNLKKTDRLAWSKQKKAFLRITDVQKQNQHSIMKGTCRKKEISISIPFIDEASVENAIHCWCMMLHLNIPEEVIALRMLRLQSVEMRLELKQGVNNCSIINDSYSADITSLQIAIDFLQQQKQHASHTVILSDILQSGKKDEELYADVAKVLKQKNISRLIGIGTAITAEHKLFDFLNEKHFFPSVEDFKKSFYMLNFHNEAILLKGARVFEFEQITGLLEQKAHQTILSINLSALIYNLKQYKKILKPETRIMAMVKAFSYGSGSSEIAHLLQYNKVDYLTVAYADEGVELRKAGITSPIMVMNSEENSFNSLVQYFLEPEIFSFSLLHSFEKYLQASGVENFPVHIKLDTGMHRLGFEPHEILLLANALQNNRQLQVQSVFSHLIASDSNDKNELTQQQMQSFINCCNSLQAALDYTFIRHISNTAAISRHSQMQLDMVRLGIGLYGVDSNPAMQQKLKNVSTLTSTISQIKKIMSGETVGYGGNAKVYRDSTIATVRIGYADGYSRSFSNGKGKMMIRNKLVPVVGNVCMDMTMVDVTDVHDVTEGDEVLIFGKMLPVQMLADWGNTIPYEIMTAVSQRVKRVYFEE
ncbi:bifunctional UDP-N-acetylmuramoyl-tripeptide:D-alanyl-D-alanine ligase/alanine racemase [soil metagenome]